MSSIDPLKDIEDRRAQMDIGVMANRVFEGAREDGASMYQAFLVTCAWAIGVFQAKPDGYDQEDEDDDQV